MQGDTNWYLNVCIPPWRKNLVWGCIRNLSVSPCFAWSRWWGKLESIEFSQVRTQNPAPKYEILASNRPALSLAPCSWARALAAVHLSSAVHRCCTCCIQHPNLCLHCPEMSDLCNICNADTKIHLWLQITAVPKTVRAFSKFVSCICLWGKINGEGWQSSCTRSQLPQNFCSTVHYLLEVGR